MTLRKTFKVRLEKNGTDMGNCREKSKREKFMEKKEWLHYPKWIYAKKEEEERSCRRSFVPKPKPFKFTGTGWTFYISRVL